MRDAIGNELREGDLVALQLERPMVYGKVIKIDQGGLIVGKSDGQMGTKPTIVSVQSLHPIPVDPMAGIAGMMIRIVDPATSSAPQADPPAEAAEPLPN